MHPLLVAFCTLVAFGFVSATGEPSAASGAIQSFSVHLADEVLADIQDRLGAARFPGTLKFSKEEDPWAYGTDLSYLKELVAYWQTSYDWRKHEAAINKWPQFTTQLHYNDSSTDDPWRLHFVHARSSRPDAIPLLFIHGWPGSFLECMKMLPMLTEPPSKDIPAFHVVCPSLPGFGFSSAPLRPRDGTPEHFAEILSKLMTRVLNYNKYVVQGGDWGGIISTYVALRDPEHCIALHTNFAPLTPLLGGKGIIAALNTAAQTIAPSIFFVPGSHDYRRVQDSGNIKQVLEETGYFHEQATRPQSIAYALTDSPVGLAGYLVEKFRVWSHCDGNVESRFSKDDLITYIMLYWINGNIASSMRLYYEFAHDPEATYTLGKFYVKQPTGIASFYGELFMSIRSWNEYFYNVKSFNIFSSGGHFAALEEPELLATDIQDFVKTHVQSAQLEGGATQEL